MKSVPTLSSCIKTRHGYIMYNRITNNIWKSQMEYDLEKRCTLKSLIANGYSSDFDLAICMMKMGLRGLYTMPKIYDRTSVFDNAKNDENEVRHLRRRNRNFRRYKEILFIDRRKFISKLRRL